MKNTYAVKFIILRSIGNFLFLLGIYGVIATFGPAIFYEAQYRVIQARGVTFEVAESQAREKPLASFADLLTGAREQQLTPIDTEFSIVIPRIGASSRIVANVDPSNEDIFKPALEMGVAHAEGSVFPGMRGNVYLFAHSADNFWNAGQNNAIFYLLKDLKEGDEVVIFYQGKRYNYFVTGSKIADPEDVSLITNAQEGNEQLILQTCWPPGTTFKRLFVFARPRKTDTIFKQ
jgi:LPXTG-site transpeptidase (sortase) family protein